MKLVFPRIEYKEKAIDYINEFYEYGSVINGAGGLDHYLKESTYEDWLENVISYIDIANTADFDVPRITYFCVREEDDRIIGMINLRLTLKNFKKKDAGHIGYSVRPTERRKHYATDILSEALKIYDRMGIEEVFVSCERDNVASAGVIMKCGGVLKDEFFSEVYEKDLKMFVIKQGK
ncbi:MAG: GNAT family N-acetyltransferase [Butyrivibrio sp.]|nr:GNAT family N-acetyltransferase [Butyrivibrio sp.]